MTNSYSWAVVGGGPAGIAVIGKLIDNGVSPKNILWLDPEFSVGDLGRLWQNVSSNTKVQLFTDFLTSTNSFEYDRASNDFSLQELPPADTCDLKHIVAPLQLISDRIYQKTHAVKTTVTHLERSSGHWVLTCDDDNKFSAENVVLATGANPQSLDYPNIENIPFEIAIDKEKLQEHFDPNQTYAVFGSSHSGIMIIRHLVELNAKKILNFYCSPCRYAVNMGDWILFDNTGLKGQTAQWAREHIDGTQPANLKRHISNASNINELLPTCDKAIYATGFERRNSITFAGIEHVNHNPYTGIIAPGLFGFGIAYPEEKTDHVGNTETQVGLWKFMTYLNRVMPIWLNYPPK